MISRTKDHKKAKREPTKKPRSPKQSRADHQKFCLVFIARHGPIKKYPSSRDAFVVFCCPPPSSYLRGGRDCRADKQHERHKARQGPCSSEVRLSWLNGEVGDGNGVKLELGLTCLPFHHDFFAMETWVGVAGVERERYGEKERSTTL